MWKVACHGRSKRSGRLGFGTTTFLQTQPAHMHFKLCRVEDSSYNLCHPWKLLKATVHQDLCYYNNFGSFSGCSFASCHKAKDLMCWVVLPTAGRDGSVWLWHVHTDMFNCGICDITKCFSIWCAVNQNDRFFFAKNGFRSDSQTSSFKISPREHAPKPTSCCVPTGTGLWPHLL